MSSTKSKRKFSAQEKASILRGNLSGKESVSDICSELSLQPSQFYSWRQHAFDSLELSLAEKKRGPKKNSDDKKQSERITHLEENIRRKEHVIAEISEELVAAKKSAGEI